MLMRVRVHNGYGVQYCTVEDPAGPFLRYRNPAVAADTTARMAMQNTALLSRDSREVGLDWFGISPRILTVARKVVSGWEFTFSDNNDRLEVLKLQDEGHARIWLSDNFGIVAQNEA